MRAWLYDTLTSSSELETFLGGASEIKFRVMPRRSQQALPPEVDTPYLIFGLGNSTDEGLCDSTANDPEDKNVDRQFFEVWIHDKGGSFAQIDEIIVVVINLLSGASSSDDGVMTVQYLETSQEFANETYKTNFRYIRFQAVKVRGGN